MRRLRHLLNLPGNIVSGCWPVRWRSKATRASSSIARCCSSPGRIAARYDKIHLFDVDLPDGAASANRRPMRAAALRRSRSCHGAASVSPSAMMCAFPQLYRSLALAGADFITVPSAFTKVTGEAHWHVLLRARAIETGCFVLAPAQGGLHESGRETYGHSLVVSPWGEIDRRRRRGAGVRDGDTSMRREVDAARRRIPALRAWTAGLP